MKVTEVLEGFAWERFSENISELLFGVNVENVDLVTFVFFADEIVLGFDVFGPLVVFGVLNKLDGSLIVGEEGSWVGRRKSKAGKEAAKSDGFFDCFSHGDELRFGSGVGSTPLAFAAPGDCSIGDKEEVPCSGLPIILVSSIISVAVSFKGKICYRARV